MTARAGALDRFTNVALLTCRIAVSVQVVSAATIDALLQLFVLLAFDLQGLLQQHIRVFEVGDI